jgi:hypothetical protein
MNFKQYKNGSCDIEFSLRERWIILKKGKLHLSNENLKHFGNNLVKLVADWHLNFNEETKNIITYEDTKIKSE